MRLFCFAQNLTFSLANENAYGNIQDGGDATEALVNGGVPEIVMAKRILTGQAHPSDYLLFLYLLNIKAKGPKTPAEDGNNNPKDEDGNQPKDEVGTNGSKGSGENQNKPKDGVEGNAYAENSGDPPGTFRDSNGKLRNEDGTFAKDPNATGKPKTGDEYSRSMVERRKALLRDANDPTSDLSDEARQFIKDNNGKKVPEGYEVSHEEPLYTRKTNEGKSELDVSDNMKTQPKETHRARHKICGDQYHEFGPANKPTIIK